MSCEFSAIAFWGIAFLEQTGVPMAAGLIVGEALVGVGYAFYQIFLGGTSP